MSRVQDQYREAQNYLAGGVSSSIRVNKALGHPMYFDRAWRCHRDTETSGEGAEFVPIEIRVLATESRHVSCERLPRCLTQQQLNCCPRNSHGYLRKPGFILVI